MASLLGLFGGPVGAIVGAVWTAVTTFIKWLFEGLVVCIANPVTAAILLAVLVVGFYFGVRHDEAALNKYKQQMVQANADAKKRVQEAEGARIAAEQVVLGMRQQPPLAAPAEAPAAVPTPIKRVRHAKPSNCSGSWLSSLPTVLGGCK